MANRLVVLGVAALLIIVSLLVVVSSAPASSDARSAAPQAALAPSVAPVVSLLSVTHNHITTFVPGQPTGRLYFFITDPNADPALVVRVADTNATRDGLTNPVASWTVDLTSGSYDSTVTGLEYTFPASLVYGGNWNLSVDGSSGGNVVVPFTVQTYLVSVEASPSNVLAGHPGTVDFSVTSEATGAPYSQITSVNLSALYYDGTTAAYEPLALNVSHFGPGVSYGSASFLLPANASRDGAIEILALGNVTSNGLDTVVGQTTTLIANIYNVIATYDCNCLENVFAPNSQIVVTAVVYADSAVDYTPANVNVSFSFSNGTRTIANSAVPGNPPANLVTNSNGFASILFLASPTVFSTSALNRINISVETVPSVDGSIPVYRNVSLPFVVASNSTSAGASLTASFSQVSYLGGSAGTATWQLTPAGKGTGWSGIDYGLYTYVSNTYTLIATGPLSGLSGTIAFTAPTNLTAELQLTVYAQNGSTVVVYSAYSQVAPAELFVTASEAAYHPGDTVGFTVQTVGSIFTTATLYYSIYDYFTGALLVSGAVVADSFTYTVPTSVAPTAIDVTVDAQSPTLGVFASGSLHVPEAAGLLAAAGISTVSQYSDGSFQPGQALTVTWSYAIYGPTEASSQYSVSLWNADGWYGNGNALAEILTSTSSGSFQYTIPSGTPAGSQSLFVEVAEAKTCSYACYSVAQVSFAVNPSPSVLNLELGAGSGLTVGWLILLIVIVLVALLLVLMIRRGRAPRSPPPTSAPITEPMSPPAPAPSTSPATEWSEPTSSGSPSSDPNAPPPLPTPPPAGPP